MRYLDCTGDSFILKSSDFCPLSFTIAVFFHILRAKLFSKVNLFACVGSLLSLLIGNQSDMQELQVRARECLCTVHACIGIFFSTLSFGAADASNFSPFFLIAQTDKSFFSKHNVRSHQVLYRQWAAFCTADQIWCVL